jgi:hypothetical protein
MLTELDVINSMLAATGTLPVTATDTTHPSYVKARVKLDEVIGAVQKLQLWFNSASRTLTPNVENIIYLPADTLNADPYDRSKNYVKRGARLFDMDNNTYEITEAVVVKLTQNVPWEDISETAIYYIKDKARYEYYLDEDGTDPKLTKYETAMHQSWAELYREHLRNRDTNIFDGSSAIRYMKKGTGLTRRLPPYE